VAPPMATGNENSATRIRFEKAFRAIIDSLSKYNQRLNRFKFIVRDIQWFDEIITHDTGVCHHLRPKPAVNGRTTVLQLSRDVG
jgi:hypothetical protein